MQTAPPIRPDADRIRAVRGETRADDRLAAHYVVETRLARQLEGSSPGERVHLYTDVYRQLFESLPDHPQHHGDGALRQDRIRVQVATLARWLGPAATYVEIGCGDAALTKAMAAGVGQAVGVDVTALLVGNDAPGNFRFLQSDGVTLDLADASVDLVYSNQLMEHLHTADAMAQLREIHRVLRPGGRYVCCTPNRLSGPHDISVYFDDEPRGFHMREYDHRSLGRIFREVGFGDVRALVTAKGRSIVLPLALAGMAEAAIEALPARVRARLVFVGQVSNLLGLTLVGVK